MYTEDRHKRVKQTGEIFTSPAFIRRMLNNLNEDWNNPNKSKTWLDPTVGTGNFLIELAKLGIPLENLHGVDLMSDNVEKCKNRLFEIFKTDNKMQNENIKKTLDKNILQDDALTFDYSIWEPFDFLVGNPPYNGKIVKNSTLYGKIIIRAVDHLKTGGEMAMIHPGLWRLKKNNTLDLGELYLSHTTKVLPHDVYFTRYIWNIVSDVDEIYLIKNNKSNLKIKFECVPTHGTLENNYKYNDCSKNDFIDITQWFSKYPVPNRNFDIFKELIRTNENDEIFPQAAKVNTGIKIKDLKKEKDSEYKYPVIQKILKEKRFKEGLFYSKTPPKNNRPKIILSWGSLNNMLDLEGKYQALNQGNYYIYDENDDKTRLTELYDLLDDPVFKRMMITFHGGDQKIIVDQRFKNIHLFKYFKRDAIYIWNKIKKERNLKEDYFFHKVTLIEKSGIYKKYIDIAKNGLTWAENLENR